MNPHNHQPVLKENTYTSFDGDTFPYLSWAPEKKSISTVLIGFHGISGAADDYKNLANALQKESPNIAVYAPNLRGQGRDPIQSRRGDLAHPHTWFRDAHTFTRLVRERHPEARIIWCGESMGSLIALHATVSKENQSPPCDALILSSPVVHISPEKLSPAKRFGLRVVATLFPKARVSLEGISGAEQTKVTNDTIHQEQVNHNDWHVPRFTLRLLRHLERLISEMPAQASKTELPVLLLHGGRDVFSHPEDIVRFEKNFPGTTTVQRQYYPQSYHLLFYDDAREHIFSDISRWLGGAEHQHPATR